MKITKTVIPDVLVLEPKVFADERGLFLESYNKRAFEQAVGHEIDFVQDNHSRSVRGVLRGLHYQLAPHGQGKLVRVASGAVHDVAVDLRPESPSYARAVGVDLTDENHRMVWIPPGFAHGFLVLSEFADVLYKTTGYYAPQAEASVRWDDPELNIAWPDLGGLPILSPKDATAPSFAEVRRSEKA
jgi:dTDP-4-dehydrorhamnose 3,5-epimerase